MNKKKRNVLDKAHTLFIEKGYHGTSIQDILDLSGISKGSFYNYFTSKGELFKAVFNLILAQMVMERDELLIGEDISDEDVFIDQVSFMMAFNRKNKLIQLVEDVLVSSEPDLIKFVKKSRDLFTNWVYERFLNIFPDNKAKYLIDCAVIYTGMMQNILHTCNGQNRKIPLPQIAKYCFDRIITILDDISSNNVQLFIQEEMNGLLHISDQDAFFNNEISIISLNLKKVIEKLFSPNDPIAITYLNLLYFIQGEVMNNKEEPRRFLIESALTTLKTNNKLNQTEEFLRLEIFLSNLCYYPIE